MLHLRQFVVVTGQAVNWKIERGELLVQPSIGHWTAVVDQISGGQQQVRWPVPLPHLLQNQVKGELGIET